MNKLFERILFALILILVFNNCKTKSNDNSLKEALKGKFYIGVALNSMQINNDDSLLNAVICDNFNSVVAENCMKNERIQPKEGEFDFKAADELVAFAEANNLQIIGHCLVWHSQTASWFFVDSLGNDVTREVLIDRMKTHITTLVGRYKGRIDGWDVVNEAFNDDGTLRNSKFLQIIGSDYIKLAFEFANQADADVEFYYNDYNTTKPEKREAIYNLVKNLQAGGVRIDGIGMQAHLTMDFPTVEEMEKSILKFSELGTVMITEMDMTVLPWPDETNTAEISTNFAYDSKWNPYPDGLNDSASVAWTNRFMDFFNVFLTHNDKISRVTIWGLNDGQTWRNNWPIKGRKDYPVLFDRENKPKPVVAEIIKAAELRN